MRASKAGATAVIIFNIDGINEHINHPFPQEGPLPMFDMRGDDGRDLIEKMSGQEKNTFTFTAEEIDIYPGDEVAGFSSKGPVMGNWDIKPDIVAPGVNIRSTVPGVNGSYQNAFDRYSGTSMAAPHIAGLAALILEARPEMDVFDVKTVLMNTSKKISPLSSESTYTIQEIGAGRVQAVRVLETEVVAQVQETAYYTKNPFGETAEEGVQHKTGSLNFGPIKEDETITKNIIIKSLSQIDSMYKVSYDLRWLPSLDEHNLEPVSTNDEKESAIISFDKQELTLPAGGSVDLNVSINMPVNANKGVYEGYLYLSLLSGEGPTIQLPFMAYKNPDLVKAISYLESNPKFLSLNGDGTDETTNLDYKYLLNMKEAQMYLWSETDPKNYGLVKEFSGEDLKKGAHRYNWDGSFFSFDTGVNEIVPSGLYHLFIQGQDEFGNWDYFEIPYIVSNEPTDILVDNGTIDQSGQKSILINENKLHGFITSTSVQIYRDFLFDILYSFYWNIISMEYELYDSKNMLLSKGDVDPIKDLGTPEKHLEYTLNGIFPNGNSRLVLRVKDKAGIVNEQHYQVQYVQETAVELVGEKEVVMNQEYELALQSNQVSDMVGAEYILTYPSKAFSIKDIEPVPGFAASTLTYEKVRTWKDEMGTEYTTLKILTDLRKNPKEHKKAKKDMIGVTGNIQTGRLIFDVTDNLMNIGHYTIKTQTSKYTNLNLEVKNLKGAEKTVEVYTKSGTISGKVSPEALLDQNGKHRTDINYIKEGLLIEIYNTKKGYGSGEENRLISFDGYRTNLEWTLDTDGSLVITGLNPKEKYDIAINYPSHFTSVVRGIQPISEYNGKLVPAQIDIDFGILKAGDVQNKNKYAQKIDITDVANVARNMGKKAVDGSYEGHLTEIKINDIDKDGQISEKDFSYSVKNFDFINSSQEGIDIGTPEELPPNNDSPTIMFVAETPTSKKGDIIPVKVELKKTSKVYALQYGFTYDPTVLKLVLSDGTVTNGGQVGEIFKGNFIELKNKTIGNRIEFAASYKGDASPELKDNGVVMTYYFQVLDDAFNETTLTWDRSALEILKEVEGSVYNEWEKETKNITFNLVK
ncbi:S8 family serine peptidase [Bacillus sp. CGMCC 1.16607]|uniref:S8 family serine peptidase n=1 Tax=Bacillus sp. CGMCC 1.16607 TaxID=3351842 RepID=UPI00364400A2